MSQTIWRLEEQTGTGVFETCLQAQHGRSRVSPVVALSSQKALPPRCHKNWYREADYTQHG